MAPAKADPSFRFALEALKHQIPTIASKALEKAPYIGKAVDGATIRASVRKGRIRVLPGRGPNDSLTIDTADAPEYITTVLLRSGATKDDAEEAARRFAELPNEAPMELTGGRRIVKKLMPPLLPDLSAAAHNDRLPALVAYEFLALLIGDQVYKPSLDPIRSFVVGGTRPEDIEIKYHQAGKTYGPIHAILIQPVQPALSIQVRFFRWLTFEITIGALQYSGPDSIYFEELVSGESFFAATHEDAHHENWLKLNPPTQ